MKYNLLELKQELKEELTHNILPFWMENLQDNENGGFPELFKDENLQVTTATMSPSESIQVWWIFAAAGGYFSNQLYLKVAERLKNNLFNQLWDEEFGGVYTQFNVEGQTAEGHKDITTQAQCIYALSEHFRATGDKNCLDKAKALFRIIEQHYYHAEKNSYTGNLAHDWSPIVQINKQSNEQNKQSCTLLLLLEAYTNLWRIWENDELGKQLENLLNLFMNHPFYQANSQLTTSPDNDIQPTERCTSFGHALEASWLLYEAAIELGKPGLIAKTREYALKLANVAAEGLQPNGLMTTSDPRPTATTALAYKCWVQAEAMVGFYNAYQLTKDDIFAQHTLTIWESACKKPIDKQKGVWYWIGQMQEKPNLLKNKADNWECLYHTGRMCLELMKRISFND